MGEVWRAPRACAECGEDGVPCQCELEWARVHYHPSREVAQLPQHEAFDGLSLPLSGRSVARQLFDDGTVAGEVEIRLRGGIPAIGQGSSAYVSGVNRFGIVLSVDESFSLGGITPGQRLLIPWAEVAEVRAVHLR